MPPSPQVFSRRNRLEELEDPKEATVWKSPTRITGNMLLLFSLCPRNETRHTTHSAQLSKIVKLQTSFITHYSVLSMKEIKNTLTGIVC